MTRRIKTAVIGVGNMGKNHVRILSELSRLVGVSDIDRNVGKQVANQYRTKYFRNYLSLLKSEKPEAVSVAVPTYLHREIAVECLRRRIPTLVEKPIAERLKDAEIMLKEARKNKTLLMIGHTERFNPVVIKLKQIVSGKKLGIIVNIVAIRIGLRPPHGVDLDVGIDLAIHDIDVINFLLNEFPRDKKVLKTHLLPNSTSDSASFVLEYSEAAGIIHSNWITPIKIRKLFVSGTKGFAELDYIQQKLVLYQKVIRVDEYGDYLDFLALADAPKKIEFISKKEPLKEELKFFLKHYKNYRFTTQAEDAIRALECALA